MKTDYQKLKEETNLKDFCRDFLEPAQKPKGNFVCPNCKSGASGRANSDSAFFIKGNKFKCFACGAAGDILDLAGIIFNTTDKKEQVQKIKEWSGLDSFIFTGTKTKPASAAPIRKEVRQTDQQAKAAADYIQQAQKNLSNEDCMLYLQARHYTQEQAQQLGIGYNPKHKRLVLPFRGAAYYVERDITGKQEPKYLKPKSAELGAQPLDNAAALDTEQAIYITEGLFDAYALELLGLPAIALAGTGTDLLLQAIQTKPKKPVLLFCLDRDAAGEQGTEQALKRFAAHKIKCKKVEIPKDIKGKDLDEMRKTSPDALKRFLTDFYSQTLKEIREEEEKALTEQLKHYSIIDTSSLLQAIFNQSECRAYISTGFKNLDHVIGGGLPNGLTTLGAVSSTGKTTLMLQIANNIAAAGKPVLFITIEQSTSELLAKSLSRIMTQQGNAATVTDILNLERRQKLDTTGFIANLINAANEYTQTIEPNMYIFECNHQAKVEDIQSAALFLTGKTGQSPVVFVDYLQLIAPMNDADTDKRIVDKNTTALRQLARDIKSPVVTISSIKRAGYDSAVTMDSYKESGSIEYSSDLLLGLQPNGLSKATTSQEITNAYKSFKAADKRLCEVVVLKNRTGKLPKQPATLTLDAAHNLFTEEQPSSWL